MKIEDRIEKYLNENELFTIDNVNDVINTIKKQIKVPYIQISRGVLLGGDKNVSIIIKLSLDKPENWNNKIFHNSRYSMFYLYNTGVLELFSKDYSLPKFRKSKIKKVDDVSKKINDWLNKT